MDTQFLMKNETEMCAAFLDHQHDHQDHPPNENPAVSVTVERITNVRVGVRVGVRFGVRVGVRVGSGVRVRVGSGVRVRV